MSDIEQAIYSARQSKSQLNRLINEYLPFIKKQLIGLKGLRLEYDDMMSLAMLTFSSCVFQYEPQKGNFFAFCGTCIKNRLIDESRKQARYEGKLVQMLDNDDLLYDDTIDTRASVAAYDLQQERQSLIQEIEAFCVELNGFGIDFEELYVFCPKQTRSRLLCFKLAKEIVSTPQLYEIFVSTQRIAQTELSARFGISKKTVEKHRKYIVALVLLMTGEYPYIQAFLPSEKKVN